MCTTAREDHLRTADLAGASDRSPQAMSSRQSGMRLPSGSFAQGRQALVALLLVALASAAGAEPGPPAGTDKPWALPHIAWLESAGGPCGPSFESPAAPIHLAPVPYPTETQPNYGGILMRVRGVIEADGSVTGAHADHQYPLATELVEQALMASTFAPAQQGGRAVPSLVDVVYEFVRERWSPPDVDAMPDDAELERRAGRELPDSARTFIAAADSIAIFRNMGDFERDAAGRDRACPVRVVDLKTCGGRYSIPHTFTEPAPLSPGEVGRVKDLLLARSPYWAPRRGEPDLKFAGIEPGFGYGLSIRHGGQEMFVLFQLSGAGTIQLRTAQDCYGGGHPYRRSTELFCELLERHLGWPCIDKRW